MSHLQGISPKFDVTIVLKFGVKVNILGRG